MERIISAGVQMVIFKHSGNVVPNAFLVPLRYPIEPVWFRAEIKHDIGLLDAQLEERMLSLFENAVNHFVRFIKGLPAHH